MHPGCFQRLAQGGGRQSRPARAHAPAAPRCALPQERQTMLFSATVPKWVKKLVKQYLNSECSGTIELLSY